ncbi:hypothetical protein ACFB49_47720 [Sphingomonas sp. DBB INV C78]|uniref:hypothetical protein n=1 Tax=Sphingomonas sp. DBB INV C78 TaxID=3349434 RepID=UPI0036D29C94
MTDRGTLRATIDALHSNVAVLNATGVIVAVNDRWLRFGRQRQAPSDFVGANYLEACARAATHGDKIAARVVNGLRNLLDGRIETFGLAYHCGDRTFRLRARHIDAPHHRIIVAHEDITALLRARRERNHTLRLLGQTRLNYAQRSDHIYEELGQRLAAISLAAQALEQGANIANAVAVIRMAVEEARREVQLLRYHGEPDSDEV